MQKKNVAQVANENVAHILAIFLSWRISPPLANVWVLRHIVSPHEDEMRENDTRKFENNMYSEFMVEGFKKSDRSLN